VAELNYDGASPERASVMILFAETRGFTRMSEILEPSVVLACMSEFFALVSAAVKRHHGFVPSVFNDTLVATFAAQGNAQHVVRAAQEIQQDFAPLAETWERDYSIRVAVAMGLHCGDIVVGLAALPMPGQLLIIGDTVSVAERLLHRARAGEFVLSKGIMDALAGARFELEAEELPPLKIPPREPIRIFAVPLDTRLDFT
jgi:adenylate cyclase